MKKTNVCLLLALSLAIPLAATAGPVLKHRYSFDQASGTTSVVDSVGGANGVLKDIGGGVPNGSDFSGSGQLYLNPNGGSDYVQLPPALVSTMTNLTLEVWYTPVGTPSDWMRIWDFGSYTGVFTNRAGFSYLCGHARNFFSYGTGFQFLNGAGSDVSLYRTPPINEGDGLTQLVTVYDTVAMKATLYVNGTQIGNSTAITAPLSSIIDTNCMFGASQYAGDPKMSATYQEFRMWEGAMTPAQVALSYSSGSDTTNLDVGPLLDLTLNVTTPTTVGGGFQSSVLADYQNVSGVVVTANGTTYYSSDNNVATVNATGFVSGINVGAVTISAVFGGLTNSQAITVTGNPAVLKHRWSFNEAPGSLVAVDSVAGADGTVVNGGGVGAEFTGTGQLSLFGGPFVGQCDVGTNGYVNLPSHLVSGLTNMTVEVWATWNNAGDWQRLVSFGRGNPDGDAGAGCQGTGSHEICIIPRRGDVGKLTWQATYFGHDEEKLYYPTQMPLNQQIYLVGIYDPLNNVMKFYADGVLVDSMAPAGGLQSLSSFDDVNCWFGRSNWSDPFYGGLINEVRIWQGDLTPAEITAHAAAGPDSLVPAPKLSISNTGSNVTVAWPTAGATGYKLYSASSLSNSTWPGGYTLVPGVGSSNGTNSVTLPTTGSAQFFVLHNP